MANSNKWKDFLLKSSLPLEYEIKKILDGKGCISSFDYGYFKKDEHSVTKEFSYDIDSSYIKDNHFFNLHVECKYRDKSTNWFFLPSEYGGHEELRPSSFLHPFDHFVKEDYPYKHYDIWPIAQACSKGIEINSNQQNPKTIDQAATQLSYAMAHQIRSNAEHQLNKFIGKNIIYYNIPIIVTTANLYRIKEDISINSILQTDDITEIAEEVDMLVLNYKISKDLERHNLTIFNELINNFDMELMMSKLNSFNKSPGLVMQFIAGLYSPEAILVINHSEKSKAFDKLFSFIDEVHNPSIKAKNYVNNQIRKMEEISRRFNK